MTKNRYLNVHQNEAILFDATSGITQWFIVLF